MTQTERMDFLISELLKEQPQYQSLPRPSTDAEKQRMLRAMMNTRPPIPIKDTVLEIQDAYLQAELQKKGIIRLSDLTPVQENLYLWQGDITTLQVDAVVNAANAQLLGCFIPCHGCIDNAIHSSSGIQLRLACHAVMEQQKQPEKTGQAKITPGFNLPCRYVLHTVGPIITGPLAEADCELLASCYRSCMELAVQYDVQSIAFCCISTGEFHFPNDIAAEIAVKTVKDFQKDHAVTVIFNVFKDIDLEIYTRLLN